MCITYVVDVVNNNKILFYIKVISIASVCNQSIIIATPSWMPALYSWVYSHDRYTLNVYKKSRDVMSIDKYLFCRNWLQQNRLLSGRTMDVLMSSMPSPQVSHLFACLPSHRRHCIPCNWLLETSLSHIICVEITSTTLCKWIDFFLWSKKITFAALFEAIACMR